MHWNKTGWAEMRCRFGKFSGFNIFMIEETSDKRLRAQVGFLFFWYKEYNCPVGHFWT